MWERGKSSQSRRSLRQRDAGPNARCRAVARSGCNVTLLVDDGDEHFIGAVDGEGLLDQEAFAVVVASLELDLEGFAEDAQGVVVGVQGAVDDGGDHAFGVVDEQRLFEDGFAGAGFAQHKAEAALLGMDTEDVEDLLLVGQEVESFGVEGVAGQAEVGADHGCTVGFCSEQDEG